MTDTRAEIRRLLWNDDVAPESYTAERAHYQDAILEQYKLYVEMADRISARRSLTNTFFLTLNSAIFTAIGLFWKDRPALSAWWLALPLLVALGQCGAWWLLVRSFRQLNGAKYAVVGVLEERLPALPYSRAEWSVLGEGRDWRKYTPLTHLEQWVPVLFAVAYAAGFVAAVA